MVRKGALTLACCTLAGCDGNPDELPPYGQALVVVQTDLAVPQVVSRLRIDLYDASGRWFESRDVARPDPRDWPVSFSVYSEDTAQPRHVWVRLRAYPEARVRDYFGERFWDWTDPLGFDPPPSAGPRLVVGGVDRTPSAEPLPLVTVDRLSLVRLDPERTKTVPMFLSSACAGTMARLALAPGSGPTLGEAASCIADEKERSIVDETIADAAAPPPPEPCPATPDPSRVCIPGGSAILGSSELTLVPEPDLEPLPERTIRISTFSIDREEVTVGRFRAAAAQGFSPSTWPIVNDGPLGPIGDASCSYTSAPAEREDFALSCVDWRAARELCQYFGGDLPTEAQWDYAASSAGSRGRTRFPWGDDEPSCERAVFGRLPLGGAPGFCEHLGQGPLSVTAAPGDRTPEGVVGLAGGVTEWTLDRAAAFTDDCWRDTALVDPTCAAPSAPERSVRGGSWPAPPSVLRAAARFGVAPAGRAGFIGLRCVYPP